jgi:hypothetical protein
MKRKKNEFEIMWACPREVCPNAGNCQECEEVEYDLSEMWESRKGSTDVALQSDKDGNPL